MESLINNLRDFNSILGNKFHPEISSFSLNNLIQEVKELFEY